MNIVIGVSDAKASNNVDDVLATYSLGSCIGVTVYDAHARVGGVKTHALKRPRQLVHGSWVCRRCRIPSCLLRVRRFLLGARSLDDGFNRGAVVL